MEYQNTHIYSRSIEVLNLSRALIASLPPGYAFLADQLRRASSSILLNFAEGYGKSSRRDARRYFCIARGSANEVAAILDVAQHFGVITLDQCADGKERCDHLVRMLTRFRRQA